VIRQFIILFSVVLCGALTANPSSAQDVPIVTIEAENKPLLDILKELGKTHGLNYVVSQKASEVAGAVHCRLKQIALDRAIQMLCAACNLEAEVQGHFVIIRVPVGGQRARFNFPTGSRKRSPGEVKTGVAGILKKAGAPVKSADAGREPVKKVVEKAAPAEVSISVGRVLSITKQTVIIENEEGQKATFHLPKPGPVSSGLIFKLKKAIETLRTGHRVVLTYTTSKSGIHVIQGVIGGGDPRKAQVNIKKLLSDARKKKNR
jgi:hypothetical protein